MCKHAVVNAGLAETVVSQTFGSNGDWMKRVNRVMVRVTVIISANHQYIRRSTDPQILLDRWYDNISPVINIKKVSNNKSNLQTHWRSLPFVPLYSPYTISYWSFIVTMYLSYTVFEIFFTYFPKIKSGLIRKC